MMNALFQKIKTFLNGTQSQRLYQQRKSALNGRSPRDRWTVSICVAFIVAAIMMLIVSSWVPTTFDDYINSQAKLSNPKFDDLKFYATALEDSECKFDINCIEKSQAFEQVSITDIDSIVNTHKENRFLSVNIKIPRKFFSALENEPIFVINLPNFRFKQAKLYQNRDFVGQYFRIDDLIATFEREKLDNITHFSLTVVFEILPSDRSIAGWRSLDGILLASQVDFEKYRNYASLKSSGTVGSMGNVAKIVLALFCLLLFVIVDSSPESLGLALFMAFEACALGISRNWIPLGWFNIENELVPINTFFQMGDILKVYFFLQLARIGKPNIWPWLIGGLAISIPYGFFMEYAYEHNFTWQYKIPRTRDTIAGGIGFFVCLQALWFLKTTTLPWRKAALSIGAIAAFFEVSKSWVAHSNLSEISPLVNTLYALMEANVGYLFTLSTFLNISTLENRVKTLTLEYEKTGEIKRQLELGQSLQKAFLTLPTLPDSVKLSCYHEAAVYVSGDTYFVHWDQGDEKVTFLLNDVTGVGVQAALKAFAGNVIARTIWVDSALDLRRRKDRRSSASNLEKYDMAVDQLLCRNEQEITDDFNAMIGAEFCTKTGVISLYRANYNFPFIAQPNFEWNDQVEGEHGDWSFDKVSLPNRKIDTIQLKPGSFVIFVSDGYIESSRDELSFTRAVKGVIANSRGILDSEAIQAHALSWAQSKGKDKKSDDNTIMVFQWLPKADEIAKFDAEPQVKSA
ncbi:SpoIIE family protein phosphatase [Oligoflexaceae bacterium]|nr:SpoIIE family protein phosphatase [Oligoflexaceae bacterium]